MRHNTNNIQSTIIRPLAKVATIKIWMLGATLLDKLVLTPLSVMWWQRTKRDAKKTKKMSEKHSKLWVNFQTRQNCQTFPRPPLNNSWCWHPIRNLFRYLKGHKLLPNTKSAGARDRERMMTSIISWWKNSLSAQIGTRPRFNVSRTR